MGWSPLERLINRTKRAAAGALVIQPDGRLLMVHERWRKEWSYPAGLVEPGESSLETCVRELGEEVNLHLNSGRFEFIASESVSRPLGRLKFDTYLVHVTEPETSQIKLQAFELTEYRWATFEEAISLTSSRLRPRLVKMLESGVTRKS